MDPEMARAEAETEREARAAHYTGPDTPLSLGARKAFRGLAWWPYDARFRVHARFERHAHPRPGNLGATGDDGVDLLEVGAFAFSLGGEPCRLLAYIPAPGESDEEYVLIPFRDATSGKDSYGGGRYLDLDPPAGQDVVLDFNRAYHPYCAHDDAWSCTIPPPQNRLPVRIEAGERLSQRA